MGDRSLSALIGLFLLLNTSCSGPIRVEWGAKDDPNRESTNGDADGPPPELAISSQWAAWESLHQQLIRRIEERTYGDSVPDESIPDCRLALENLSRLHPGESHRFQSLQAEYEDLQLALRLGPIRAQVRRLERLGREVERVRP